MKANENNSYQQALWSWYSPFSQLHVEPLRSAIYQISFFLWFPRDADAYLTDRKPLSSSTEAPLGSGTRRQRAAVLTPSEWRRGRGGVQASLLLLVHCVFCGFYPLASHLYTQSLSTSSRLSLGSALRHWNAAIQRHKCGTARSLDAAATAWVSVPAWQLQVRGFPLFPSWPAPVNSTAHRQHGSPLPVRPCARICYHPESKRVKPIDTKIPLLTAYIWPKPSFRLLVLFSTSR